MRYRVNVYLRFFSLISTIIFGYNLYLKSKPFIIYLIGFISGVMYMVLLITSYVKVTEESIKGVNIITGTGTELQWEDIKKLSYVSSKEIIVSTSEKQMRLYYLQDTEGLVKQIVGNITKKKVKDVIIDEGIYSLTKK